MELAKAQKLAESLMNQHGLTSPKWTFHFDNARRRFGVCKYNRFKGTEVIVRGTISLSKYLVSSNDELTVKDTILHEIAHGLTPGHGHDSVWKRKCVEIGAKPERCYNSKDVNTDTVKELARYKATCGGCGETYVKHRMPTTVRKVACRCQSGKSWATKITLNFIDTKAI